MNPDRDPFDPTLDALLRADSVEEPSPDVDAAILAAAHRAVQSAPRETAKPAEATSPWRWWMPLAAAATIGAITIGVLQLAPKEPQPTATIVSDVPPTETRAAPETAAPAPAPPPAAPLTNDRSEAPRVQSEPSPSAKVRVDRPAPAPLRKNEAMPANPPPEDLPKQERDTAEQGSAAGALMRPEAPRAAAPAVAKQSAADAQVMSPEQRITRIRALLNEGRNEDAARELIAFRSAYTDADARLPPDLQAWAATIKR